MVKIGEIMSLSTFGAVGDESKGLYPLQYLCREAGNFYRQFGWQRGYLPSQYYLGQKVFLI